MTQFRSFEQSGRAEDDNSARTILFVDSATTARSTLQQLFYGLGIPNLVLVNSRTESLAGPISSWISGTGLTIAATDNLSVRSLTIHVLR